MYDVLLKLENWIKHPWLDAVVGVILLFTALKDVGDTFFNDVMSGNVGVSHGILILGLVHIIKTLPPVLSSLRTLFFPGRA